jgi:hypothetical protein
MFAAAHRIIAVALIAVAWPCGRAADAGDATPLVSAAPVVLIDGGSREQRRTVVDAVDRYLSVGLLLPELAVRIHVSNTGCGGKQGLFHQEGDVAVIDLCYPGEFLALHEIGHAWERFNLDDGDRAAFQQLTGATTWRSTDVAWGRRGAEQAANTMAHGLLSTPLESLQHHAVHFARFEALTGITSPRITELVQPKDTTPGMDDTERVRLAAYEAWRHSSSTAG